MEHHHRHHAVVLSKLSLNTRLFRPCVERGGAVRSAQVIGDLDHVEYDYIITLQASARDLQVVCRCKLSP